jgi:hypothetical protein
MTICDLGERGTMWLGCTGSGPRCSVLEIGQEWRADSNDQIVDHIVSAR